MATAQTCDEVLVSYDHLYSIGVEALELVGVPEPDVRIAIQVLLDADLRGIDTHGIQRLLMYLPRIRKGLMNPRPDIRVDSISPVIRKVHGDNGMGQVVAARGVTEAIELAKAYGIGLVVCDESNHFGAAACFVQMACEQRMIGIVGTNAFPTMAPWGGLKNVVGNNPFAVGVPCEGDTNFILDIALSVSSRGRIRQISAAKGQIPQGWALDANGAPTTNPLEALKGFVLPIGGHKGYGLALAIDILTGVLTGAGFADGVKSLLQQWNEPQHVGHAMLVIDPTRFMPWDDFANRMRHLRVVMRSAPPIDPRHPVLMPGEPDAQIEAIRRRDGIPIPEEAFQLLKGLTRGQYDYEIPKF
jgi:ureidoglycolate dehydrogenase (NAD+)